MKLTSLISILFASGSQGAQKGLWRLSFQDSAELESKILNIHQSFCDSDEALSEPKVICDWILNHTQHQVYQPDLDQFEREPNFMKSDLAETNPELYGQLYKAMIEQKQRERAKAGMLYIDFTKDEFYNLFSQAAVRDQKLKLLDHIL